MSFRHPLFAAALLCASAATADDWPAFRGPDRDGVSKETGLLQSWPKDGPPKVWTAKNLGAGFGSVVVADGKIFGLGTRDGKEVVWALKESDGAELWATPFSDPRGKLNQNNGPSGTPTFADGKLYAVGSTGKLACLDAANGKLDWQYDYQAVGRLPSWGFTESPLVDGDKVVCIPGSASAAVVALNKDTGKEIWKTEFPGGIGGGNGYSSAVKMTLDGIPMYLALLGDRSGLVGVHADTGRLLWQYSGKAATGGIAQIPLPVVKGDRVWVSTSYSGGAALLQLAPSGKDKVAVKELKSYKKPELNNHHGGMALVGDHVYFGHEQKQGMPVCVEMESGKIKWGGTDYPAGASGSAAVIYADGRLYFRYQNHAMVLMEASPEGMKVVSSFKLPEPSGKESWAHPAIANGKLYIRDQDKLHCFNVKADKN